MKRRKMIRMSFVILLLWIFLFPAEIEASEMEEAEIEREAVQEKLLDEYDVVIVEADGSRGLPLKCPGDQEPVIPDGTDLVIGVAGATAIGQTFREACHRFPVACRYLGRSPEEKITAEDLAVCLTSDVGQKKQVACEYRYLVNQAEELDEETREALCHLLEKGKDYGAAVSFFQKR